MPNIMIVAQEILQIFCSQGSKGLQCELIKGHNSSNNTSNGKEDHWSCIAHLSAEDMLKSVVIEENKLICVEVLQQLRSW